MGYVRFTLQLLLVFSLFLGSASCSKNKAPIIEDTDSGGSDSEPVDGPQETALSLDIDSAYIQVGDTLVVRPAFEGVEEPQKLYTWEIANEDVLDLVFIEEDYSLKVVAKKTGITSVTLKSDDGELKEKGIVSVGIEDDGILRILAIGNSFSEDALEHYLHGLAEAADVEVIIGNLYIGGSSLAQHWQNASNNAKAYDFRRIDVDGNLTHTPNSSLSEIIASENWNYISLQQVSQETGLYNTYVTPFPKLYDFVKRNALNSDVKMVFHQVWAYQQTSTHSGFVNYNNDQMTMYEAIVDAVWRAARLRDIDVIVPAGTAIQNARTTLLGDNFNRDGYHLNAMGQFVASCAWLEAILGVNAVGNTFRPENLTELEVEIAQHAAREAMEHPKEVTVLEDYLPPPPTGIQESPVFIGFGSDNIANYPGWNAFSGFGPVDAGNKVENLVDYESRNTGAAIEITKSFNTRNDNGVRGIGNVFGVDIPDDVAGHSYYGNTGSFGRGTFEESILKVTGLDKDLFYDFCFYASREAGGVRETKYIVSGQNSKTGVVDVVNGDINKRTVCVENIQPNSEGEVVITVTKGDNNDQGAGFFYLNFMRISRSEDQSHGMQDAPVLIGFGSENIGNYPGWNAFTGADHAKAGNEINGLVDSDNVNTGVSISIDESFNGRNDNGIRGIQVFGLDIPDDVAGHSYFGNSSGTFGDGIYEQAVLTLTGLDKQESYDFCLYGSREAGGVRETKYTVTGSNSKTGSVDVVSGNIDDRSVCIEGVQPDESGKISITVTEGDNNDTGQGFYYLNFMKFSKR